MLSVRILFVEKVICQNTPIFEYEDRVGKMWLSCVSLLRLSTLQILTTKTRLQLHPRDPKGDVLGAAAEGSLSPYLSVISIFVFNSLVNSFFWDV